jgi:hypothetical protein
MACFQSILLSKGQMSLDLTRSRHPSFDGDCALKPRDTLRFETTVTLSAPFGLMDSRRYRVLAAPSLKLTPLGGCRIEKTMEVCESERSCVSCVSRTAASA